MLVFVLGAPPTAQADRFAVRRRSPHHRQLAVGAHRARPCAADPRPAVVVAAAGMRFASCAYLRLSNICANLRESAARQYLRTSA
jgi:hypothetical protein